MDHDMRKSAKKAQEIKTRPFFVTLLLSIFSDTTDGPKRPVFVTGADFYCRKIIKEQFYWM